MSDKDPPPFGYTFGTDLFPDGAATPLDTHGQSLLTDMEGQSLADFFSNTDPFSLADSQPFGLGADAKLAGTDFADWHFMAPPTVHHVSATIPDGSHADNQHSHGQDGSHPDNQHSHGQDGQDSQHRQHHQHHTQNNQHNPHHDQQYHQHTQYNQHTPSLFTMSTTHDDLQAAETLFAHAQQPSHSTTPMVATEHGLLNEQLAALLPNHAAPGTFDAQLAAHWAGTDAHLRLHHHFGPPLPRPALKRTYTFGTDDSFTNPAVFSAPHNESEEHVTRRLMRDTHTLSYIGHLDAPDISPAPPAPADHPTPDDHDSDHTTSADDDQPSKKRKKSTHIKKESIRKTAPGTRVAKPKKPASSTADGDTTKKRASASAAASKLARENLSEEQKRSNHILSEQKRRNLIKRGFDDLHHLVPEIRNGGLSKSSVLTEAANFLDKLIADNEDLMRLISGEPA